jgi:hypothetical protein
MEEPPTGVYIGRAERVKKLARCRFPSFRGRKPQSRNVSQLQTAWTPVFTGVTTKMDFSQLPTGGPHPRVLARLLARFAGRGRSFNIYNL